MIRTDFATAQTVSIGTKCLQKIGPSSLSEAVFYIKAAACTYHAFDPVPVHTLSPELFCFSQGPSSTDIS